DLTVVVERVRGRTVTAIEYNGDILAAGDADRLLAQLHRVLAAASADPDAEVEDLPLSDDVSVADGGPSTVERPVHTRVEERAAAHPAKAAVVLGDRSVAYGELNAAANRLARALRRAGVGPEVAV